MQSCFKRWAFGANFRAGIVLLTTIVLVSCSGKPSLSPLPADATIVAFGDSLTTGVGATPALSYPAVLGHLSGLHVINAGVSGETTAEGRQRLAGVLADERPDLLILLEGGNDILRNRAFASIEQDLAAMIELAQEQSIPVVLLGVPEKSLFSYSAPFYEELAERYGLVYDGEIIGTLMRDQAMKSDPIHFNAEGYGQLARTVHELLQDRGAL